MEKTNSTPVSNFDGKSFIEVVQKLRKFYVGSPIDKWRVGSTESGDYTFTLPEPNTNILKTLVFTRDFKFLGSFSNSKHSMVIIEE